MVELITRTATSHITRVTGAHFCAQMLPGDFLMRRSANIIRVPTRTKTKSPFPPIRMAQQTIRGRARCHLKPRTTGVEGPGVLVDYDGNSAGKIVAARSPWLRQRNVTEARNRRLPFAGSRLQLAEQRDGCSAQVDDVGRHFGQMRASNRCELC